MFKRLIMNEVLGVIWLIGTIVITIVGAVLLTQGIKAQADFLRALDNSGGRPLIELIVVGLALLIVGNLLWRLFCECLVVIFKIHDFLSDINTSMKEIVKQTSKT
jgi:hypothetical protein